MRWAGPIPALAKDGGVREALETVRPGGGRFVAHGRDLTSKARGERLYLSRAVDQAGLTVEFYLSRRGMSTLPRRFVRKALKRKRVPAWVTLGVYTAPHRAVTDSKEKSELPKRVRVRGSKVLEQPDRARPLANQTAVAAGVGDGALSRRRKW